MIIAGDSDVVTARQAGRELAMECGFKGSDLTLIATAISEIARNTVVFAGRGEMTISPLNIPWKARHSGGGGGRRARHPRHRHGDA
jgi:anti-sigma regulatory factor (Ser/Thr protein kinase)